MTGFVYYIPGANGFADAARHIPHAIDPARAAVRGALQGPDGGRGAFFGRGQEMVVDGLQWSKAPGDRAWWIGVKPDETITPEDLDKGISLPSVKVYLGDGRPWRIPVALLPDNAGARGESPLPKVRKLREDGAVERVVASPWRDLYLAADEVWDLFSLGTEISPEREMAIAAIAVGAQYHVSAVELSILGVLTDQALSAIFMALVALPDWPRKD